MKKRKKEPNPNPKSKRVNLRIPTELRLFMQDYVDRKNTSLTAIVVQHFEDIKKQEETNAAG
jgi:hypothetical protein